MEESRGKTISKMKRPFLRVRKTGKQKGVHYFQKNEKKIGQMPLFDLYLVSRWKIKDITEEK